MTQTLIIVANTIVGTHSFTTGFVASPRQVPKTENEILLHALWLERQGYVEEALHFLEAKCPKK